jgi:hypothetical protein
VQAGARGQLGGRDRPAAGQGAVQAEAVAEMDHQRDHLTLLVAPDLEGKETGLVGVHRVVGHALCLASPAAAGP